VNASPKRNAIVTAVTVGLVGLALVGALLVVSGLPSGSELPEESADESVDTQRKNDLPRSAEAEERPEPPDIPRDSGSDPVAGDESLQQNMEAGMGPNTSPGGSAQLDPVRYVREREAVSQIVAGGARFSATDPEFGTPEAIFRRSGDGWQIFGSEASGTPASLRAIIETVLTYLETPDERTRGAVLELSQESDRVFIETALAENVSEPSGDLLFARLFAVSEGETVGNEYQYVIKVRTGERWILVDLFIEDGDLRDLILSYRSAADRLDLPQIR
jgi:hypothetical protein